MFRISFIPIFIFHQKNPWWRWGPDLGPLLDTPISRPLVLLTVFFSTYIMLGHVFFHLKLLWNHSDLASVRKLMLKILKKKSEKRGKKTTSRKYLFVKWYVPNFLHSHLHFPPKKSVVALRSRLGAPTWRPDFTYFSVTDCLLFYLYHV